MKGRIGMGRSITVIPAKSRTETKQNSQRVKKLRMAAYCRVSTEQDDQLHSFAAQVEYYTKYINEHENYELADIYADVYNLKMIPFDTIYTVQTPKITAFEGKNASRKPLFSFFEVVLLDCRVHQCTQQIRGGCICTQAK